MSRRRLYLGFALLALGLVGNAYVAIGFAIQGEPWLAALVGSLLAGQIVYALPNRPG